MTTERPHRVMAMPGPDGTLHECLDCGQKSTGDAPPHPCPGPQPGAPVGDHPMERLPGNPGTHLLTDQVKQFSGGVVVMASMVYGHDGTTVYPSLVFRFATVDGGFLPPIVLVCTEDGLRKLVPLITRGVDLACDAATKARNKEQP